MAGSDHNRTSSSSNLDKQRPLIPIGVDENGKLYQEHDKQSRTATRHFMSPTISATSKFNHSRKKILGESNESFDDLRKISKSIAKPPISDLYRNNSSDRNAVVSVSDNSSSKPYDPLTNCLGERPRFLRYKPNRRCQILLGRELEEKEGRNESDVESDCGSSCGSLAQSRSDETDDSIDSDDEFEIEFEEVEDERLWSFRGVFKGLMLLFVLVVSTSYICCMNLPTSSPVVLAVSGVRYGYNPMQNKVLEYVNRSFLLSERFDRVIEEEKIVDARIEAGEDEEILEQEEEEWNEIIDGGNVSDFSDFEGPEIADVSVFEQVVEEPSRVGDELEKEGFVEESIIEGIFESERLPIGNVTYDVDKIGDGGENSVIKSIEIKQIESVLKAVIGVFIVLSSFIALRVLIRRRVQSSKSRIAREKITPPTSPIAVFEPSFESVPAHEEQNKPIESATADFGIPKSLINSMEEEASKCGKERRSSMSLSRESQAAPIVELLGELQLSEISTSFRSCGMKNSRVFETEVSSLSVFMERAKIRTKPVHASTFNSPPYPDEKKPPMKQKEREGGSTEGKNELITPVRRSSRIRNRALSP